MSEKIREKNSKTKKNIEEKKKRFFLGGFKKIAFF